MPDSPAFFAFDVFLSHNSEDKPRVRRLAERLKAAGVQVWLDEWVIKAGDIIALKVDEGLDQSRVLLLCISPAALASGWVGLERSTVIHRDPANESRRFIPLLLADCKLPDTLRRYKYVDFREETEAAFEELLIACHPKPTRVPPAPDPAAETVSTKKKSEAATTPEKVEPLAVQEYKLTGVDNMIDSIAVSPDGEWVASCCGGEVEVWDLQTGEFRGALGCP